MLRRSKFGNRRQTVDGLTFDSKKESKRYAELKLLEKAGEIKDLILQPKFKLIEKIKWNGETLRTRYYIADFQYTDIKNCQLVVEDVKGFKTPEYLLKRQLFLTQYPQYWFSEI